MLARSSSLSRLLWVGSLTLILGACAHLPSPSANVSPNSPSTPVVAVVHDVVLRVVPLDRAPALIGETTYQTIAPAVSLQDPRHPSLIAMEGGDPILDTESEGPWLSVSLTNVTQRAGTSLANLQIDVSNTAPELVGLQTLTPGLGSGSITLPVLATKVDAVWRETLSAGTMVIVPTRLGHMGVMVVKIDERKHVPEGDER